MSLSDQPVPLPTEGVAHALETNAGYAEVGNIIEDEGLGSDGQSETTSLASTIMRHRIQHGCSYHKYRGGENDYWGPNDEQRHDQLDLGHHMLTILLEKQLLLAPMDATRIKHVLDAGCGIGVWSIEFADDHPKAEVIRLDLSPFHASEKDPHRPGSS